MGMKLECLVVMLVLFLSSSLSSGRRGAEEEQIDYYSVVGDGGMMRYDSRVAIEAWNYCNEVGEEEAPNMGSPRQADCFDLVDQDLGQGGADGFGIKHLVTEADNKLGVGDPFPLPFNGQSEYNGNNTNIYAVEKELYLGSKCEKVHEAWSIPDYPWHFWMIMVKNGNLDTNAGMCLNNGRKLGAFNASDSQQFSCFGKGCMNQPLMFHNYTTTFPGQNHPLIRGSFYGTYDLDADFIKGLTKNISYYSVTWEKDFRSPYSWLFHHVLRTSNKYPSLILNFRTDTAYGFSAGYPYRTRGMLKQIPESPKFKLRFKLYVKQGGGLNSQFNLLEMGSCWKNNGQPCDGNTTTDVTRYTKMIISPNTTALCNPNNLKACPPYHTLSSNGTRIHRNDTTKFPYKAYHSYCAPGNAEHLEEPYQPCNPYSNPQPQEILQMLPHPVWGEYGYPTKQGDGWIRDPRTWELEAGKLSQALFSYQDPMTTPARRIWTSFTTGAEIYRSPDQVAEWTVSDVNIMVPDITISY